VSVVEGKVVVVTGAAGGLGRDYARYFARDGAHVVVADAADGNDAAREATAEGPRCLYWPTDVASRRNVEAMVEAALSAFGHLDVLVNNARRWGGPGRAGLGAPEPGSPQDGEMDQTGAWRCYQATAPIMTAAGWGRIVNLCGAAQQRPERRKGRGDPGLDPMTAAMARGLEATGVTVNAVAAPSGASSAVDRLRASRDVYGAINYLCSPAADWVTGQTLRVEPAGRRR
jgi:NAD(P)-dependent dehydrogenase (short-subunit alcohol dehydrogenase family)